MKKIMVLSLFVCISCNNDIRAMNYLNNAWNNIKNTVWKKYVEWRNENLIESLEQNKLVGAYKKALTKPVKKPEETALLISAKPRVEAAIEQMVEEQYQRPSYVSLFSWIPIKESEQSRIKRFYQQFLVFFDAVFYPKGGSQLSPKLTDSQKIIVGDINASINLALSPTTEVSLENFRNLVEKTKTLITQSSLEKKEAILAALGKFYTLPDTPHISWIERFHRDNTKNRIKNYFALKQAEASTAPELD